MEPFEIALIALVFIVIIAIPLLKKFIVYQFISLVIVAFIIGSLFNEIFKTSGMDIQSSVLLILLVGGLVYNSIKFYKKNVA